MGATPAHLYWPPHRAASPLLVLFIAAGGDSEQLVGATLAHLYWPLHRAASVPCCPQALTEARVEVYTFLRNQEVTAICRVHLARHPPAASDHPRRPTALSPTPGLGLWRNQMGRVARAPAAPMPIDGQRPVTPRGRNQGLPPGAPGTAQHRSPHNTGAPLSGRDDVKRTAWQYVSARLHMPDSAAKNAPPSGTTASAPGPAPPPPLPGMREGNSR